MRETADAIVVSPGSAESETRRRADAVAAELGLPIVAAGAWSGGEGLALVVEDERIELRDAARPRDPGVSVDFRSIDRRTGTGNLSRRQPLGRAIGRDTRTVVDATAGFGHDSALLALMGWSVIAIERSPVVGLLLEDGVRRARAEPFLADALGDRLEVRRGDARVILPTITPAPDAIYIDPMFPPKRKASALARKPVRVLRALVGDDDDAAALLETARACAAHRVIVKRSSEASALAPDPAFSIRTKLVRYDVYVRDATAEA